MKTHMTAQKFKNILVFNPSFIGDSILTTPLINALNKTYPESHIYFCVRPESAALFEGLDTIKEVVTFDKRKTEKGLFGFFSALKKIKKINPDLILSPHKSFRSSLLVKAVNAKTSIGFDQSVFNFLYSHTVNRDMSLHEVERNLKLLEPLLENKSLDELKSLGGQPETHIGPEANVKISHEERPLIGLCPTSVWETKMWPTEKFAQLSDRLYEKGFMPVIFAAPNEMHIIEKFKSFAKNQFLDLSGKTLLGEMPAHIKMLDALVTNDSSPLHIAVSQDIPTVSIFGPTTKSLGFYPYDKKSILIENKELTCRPCGLHGSHSCPKKHFRCMLDISVDEVYNATLRVAKKQSEVQ